MKREIPQFVEAARGHRLEALWSTFLIVGLRSAEAFGLRWRDVDLDEGVLHVRFQIQRIRDRQSVDTSPRRMGSPKLPVFVEPKTEQSKHPVPIPPELVEILRAHRERQQEEIMVAGSRWRGDQWQDLVFCTTIGTPLDSSNVIKQFRQVLASAGLDTNRRVHDLRHTCATMLALNGAHPREAQEILRHAHIQTTLSVYTHVEANSVRAAMDRLGAMMVIPKETI